jgi:ubiquinone/menaquinone biosynthesis C-methylase UbiE
MTAPLTDAFDSVFAIDVSADQIANARRLLGDRANRVEFSLVDRPQILLPASSCSGMFSTHVFQHFSSYDGVTAYLTETYRVLRTGASVCFHLPVRDSQHQIRAGFREIAHRAAMTVRRDILRRNAIMEFHRYPTSTVFSTLRSIGFRDLELRIFDMSSNADPHSFFFARK